VAISKLIFNPEDRGDKFLRNVGSHMDCMALHPRSWQHTYSYFQFENKLCQQNEGRTMGNSKFPVVSNIFMEQFEEIALDAADHKPTKWFRYVDTIVV
jgi:hypothetical protein